MAGGLKYFLLLIFAFVGPILLALVFLPFFPRDIAKETVKGPRLIPVPPFEDTAPDRMLSGAKSPLGYLAKVPAAEGLDPLGNSPFLVSVEALFFELPEEGVRHNIVEKYERDRRPYPGWAFGVYRHHGELLPQIYWRDDNGRGGWFTFSKTELELGERYRFTLVCRAGEFLSLYLDSIGDGKEPNFLGAHEIDPISGPNTDAPLMLVVTRGQNQDFNGEILSLVVATPSIPLVSVSQLKEVLSESNQLFSNKTLSTEVQLWLDSELHDKSAFSHDVSSAFETSVL